MDHGRIHTGCLPTAVQAGHGRATGAAQLHPVRATCYQSFGRNRSSLGRTDPQRSSFGSLGDPQQSRSAARAETPAGARAEHNAQATLPPYRCTCTVVSTPYRVPAHSGTIEDLRVRRVYR